MMGISIMDGANEVKEISDSILDFDDKLTWGRCAATLLIGAVAVLSISISSTSARITSSDISLLVRVKSEGSELCVAMAFAMRDCLKLFQNFRLEDVDFTLCKNITHRSLKLIGRSCPLLKSLKVNNEWHKYPDDWFNDDSDDEFSLNRDEDAISVAQMMPGLRRLLLFGNQITNEGLKKILDGCPHLESLDVRYCFNLDLGRDLGRICAERIKKLLLPNDSIAGYEFSPSIEWRNQQLSRGESPVRHWWDPYGNYDSSD